MICPHCKQEAPTIVRGLRAYCTACGAPRSLLGGETPVNVAGHPSRLGGGVANVLGWFVLLGGALTALAIGALFQALWPTVILGYVVGGFLGGMSLLFGLGLIFGGRKLQQSGDERSRSAREQAVFALAGRHGGAITAHELARALAIPEPEADALLTAMAKRPDGRVNLEVEDDGTLRYTVRDPSRTGGSRISDSSARFRVPTPPTADAEQDALAETEAEQDASAPAQRTRR